MSIIKNKKVYIAVIIITIFILFLSIRGCSKNISVVYKYDKITKGTVQKTISVTGRLELMNSYVVLSRISGVVTNVYADYNQRVSKGQLLASIDSSEIEQKIVSVDSEMERAAFDLLSAKRDMDAKEEMLKDGLISKKGMELAELNYKKISSQLKQLKNEYDLIKKKKSYTRILAPGPGIIISKDIESNIPVNENKTLFVIAEDLRRMRLLIQVDESDIGYINKGQHVSFTVSAFPEKVFKGNITEVRLNPITTGQIVSYQSLVTCDNVELLLKPGMTATAIVEVSDKKNVLRAPNEAFIVSPVDIEAEVGKKYLWKKQGMSIDLPVKRIEVKIGLVGDYYTEVVSGDIKSGDEILVGIQKALDVKESIR